MSKTETRATVERVSASNQHTRYSVEESPDVALWGPPGTGKTTSLMEILQSEINDGTRPEDIAGLTYRRNMAADFREQAAEIVGDTIDEGWYRTTHSACFRLLDLRKEDVVDGDALRTFCESHGYGWDDADPDPDTAENSPWMDQNDVNGNNTGEMLAAIRSWCINMGLDPRSDWRMAEVSAADLMETDITDRAVTEFNNEYESWKASEDLYDFDDMLLEVIQQDMAPPVEVLIEDEFQDKTPIQVELYNTWASQCNRVYVAGDPFQSIYMFQGTDPKFMADAYEMADEQRFLDTSYRLGPGIVSAATDILTSGGHDLPNIDPVGDADVEEIFWTEYADTVSQHPATPSAHLVRANFMARDVANVLSDAAVPFESRTATWTDKQRDIYNAVCRARAAIDSAPALTRPEFDLTPAEKTRLGEILPGAAYTETKSAGSERLANDADLLDVCDLAPLTECLVGNPFSDLESNETTLVRSSIGTKGVVSRLERTFSARDGQPIQTIDHEITTIHGAKGQEWPHVYLIDSTTRKIQRETDRYIESLVWYVGATRASDTLHIVRNAPCTSESQTYY